MKRIESRMVKFPGGGRGEDVKILSLMQGIKKKIFKKLLKVFKPR